MCQTKAHPFNPVENKMHSHNAMQRAASLKLQHAGSKFYIYNFIIDLRGQTYEKI